MDTLSQPSGTSKLLKACDARWIAVSIKQIFTNKEHVKAEGMMLTTL